MISDRVSPGCNEYIRPTSGSLRHLVRRVLSGSSVGHGDGADGSGTGVFESVAEDVGAKVRRCRRGT